ncbi:MAG: PHP-associated domain-containing protein [Phycisphaerae bacterium]|jgi:hypothetical protein
MRQWKTVIHVHTDYSDDANRSPAEVVETARRQGVDCVAITDHDDIRGAILGAELGGEVRVIVGEEVSTAEGHLLGLFLKEAVPPGLSAEETARRIHEQGGLVLAPHPFCTLCEDNLGSTTVALAPHLDAVEVHNSQNFLPWQDRRAAKFARAHGLPMFVGADAHLKGTLAGGYQIMPEFDGPAGFLAALRQARLVRRRFGPIYIASMVFQDLWSRVFGRSAPGFGVNAPGNQPVCAASDLPGESSR